MPQHQHSKTLHSRARAIPIVSVSLLLLLTLALVSPVSDNHVVHAASEMVNGNEIVASEVELTLGKEGTSVELSPTSSTIATGHIALLSKVSVKNSGGYTVTLQANKSALTSGTNTIPAMEGTATIDQIPENTWGYAVAEDLTGVQYHGVTESNGTPTTTTILTNKATGDNITEDQSFYLSFATRINANQPAGNYTNSVTLSVVSEPGIIPTFSGVKTMQDLTATVCKEAKVNDTAYLRDTRDNNYYWVTKLADGNCWMSQNLALDLTAGKDINKSTAEGGSSLVSNASASSYVPEATTMTPSTNDRYSNTYANNANAVYSWNESKYVIIKPEGAHTKSFGITLDDGGIKSWADNNYDNKNILNTNGVETESQRPTTSRVTYTVDGVTYDGVVADVSGEGWMVAEDPNFTSSSSYTVGNKSCNKTPGWSIATDEVCGKVYDAHYLVGNYYQWFAATAQTAAQGSQVTGNGDVVSSSICPKNWQLPTSGEANQGNGSFYNMLKNYGNLATGFNSGVTLPDGKDATGNMAESPLFFTRSGDVNPSVSKLWGVGRLGVYWSSASNSSAYAYYLYFNQSGVYPSYSDNRYYGFPVRCLVLSPAA